MGRKRVCILERGVTVRRSFTIVMRNVFLLGWSWREALYIPLCDVDTKVIFPALCMIASLPILKLKLQTPYIHEDSTL